MATGPTSIMQEYVPLAAVIASVVVGTAYDVVSA
jgi:hypothetical protein